MPRDGHDVDAVILVGKSDSGPIRMSVHRLPNSESGQTGLPGTGLPHTGKSVFRERSADFRHSDSEPDLRIGIGS